MHSAKNALGKVDVPQLKEYIKGVRDPLRSPPVPYCRKDLNEALEYEGGFRNKELKTQARFRAGVNKLIKEIMADKGGRSEGKKRDLPVEGDDRTSMRYSGMVKVGNWEAERGWAEEEMGRFLRLRTRRELGVQRTRELLSQALQPVQLLDKERLQLGDRVQVVAPRATTFRGRGAGRGLSLSVVLETGLEGAVLSGSPLLAPCARNTFQLSGLLGGPDRGPLRYGQEFALRYTGTSPDLPFYVSALPERIVPVGNASHHPQVHLTSRLCWAAGWRALPPSRLGTLLGKEVPVGGEVLVISTLLNRTLSAETGHWFSTLFGLECEATAYQYPTGDHNIWQIV